MIKPSATDMSSNFHLEVTEDEKHYYVAIDRDYRERAKAIAQRYWDAAIAKWVYPRTPEILEALSAAFADRPEAFKIQQHRLPKASAAAHSSPSTTPKALRPTPKTSPSVVPPVVTTPPQNPHPKSSVSPAPTPSQLESSLSKIQQLLSEERTRSQTVQKWITAIDARLANLPAQTVNAPSPASGIDLEELEASFAQVDRMHDLLIEERNRSTSIEARLKQIESHLAKIPAQLTKVAPALPAAPAPSTTGDEILNEVRSALAQFAERICFEQQPQGAPSNDSRNLSAWLSEILVRGTFDDPTFVDVCGHWNLIRDDRRVIDDLEAKLKNRLRECLRLPESSKKSLNELCDEYYDSVGDRERSKLLSAFRYHRNKLTHEPREPEPIRWIRYLHTLTAIALVWPKLGQGRQQGSFDEVEPGDDD